MEVMVRCGDAWEKGQIIIDSGAAENMMPRQWYQQAKALERMNGVGFIAANGVEIGNYGRKFIEFYPLEFEYEPLFSGGHRTQQASSPSSAGLEALRRFLKKMVQWRRLTTWRTSWA